MYLLAPAEFNQRDWTLSLILAAAIGSAAIHISASVVRSTFDSADAEPPWSAERRKEKHVHARSGPKQKGPSLAAKPLFSGAEGGTRTHTLLRAADFESAASTDSATSARTRSIAFRQKPP